MGFTKLFLIALSLSMDAFAVAVCKGLSLRHPKPRHYIVVGLYFGVFQALMPVLGYWLADTFRFLIENVAHWVAFALLLLIGVNMIRESRSETECVDCSTGFRSMLPLAVATSIDAMAVGVSFALVGEPIVPAITLIGLTTLVLSALGVFIGSAIGTRYKSRAELAGGIVLILIAIELVLEHYGVF